MARRTARRMARRTARRMVAVEQSLEQLSPRVLAIAGHLALRRRVLAQERLQSLGLIDAF